MAIQIHVLDHVLCPRLGTEEFKVLSMDDRHFNLQSLKTGEKHRIYKAHCHTSLPIVFANRARRQMRAQEIGRPQVKPGKNNG